MNKALTDGNWFVDNNKLSEQLVVAHRTKQAINDEGTAQPKLLPLKSYRNEHINLSVYCHIFSE